MHGDQEDLYRERERERRLVETGPFVPENNQGKTHALKIRIKDQIF